MSIGIESLAPEGEECVACMMTIERGWGEPPALRATTTRPWPIDASEQEDAPVCDQCAEWIDAGGDLGTAIFSEEL